MLVLTRTPSVYLSISHQLSTAWSRWIVWLQHQVHGLTRVTCAGARVSKNIYKLMKNIYRCTCQSLPVAESERTEEGCERKRSKRGKQYNLFNFMKSIQNNLFGFDKNRNNYYSYTNKGKVVIFVPEPHLLLVFKWTPTTLQYCWTQLENCNSYLICDRSSEKLFWNTKTWQMKLKLVFFPTGGALLAKYFLLLA